MRVGGIVLCGGKSQRMGVAKATLPFGDELMLQRVVRLLGEVVQPIAVVAAPGQPLPPLAADVLITRDEREGRGPLEGLQAGLSALGDRVDAVYATACDVPLLEPAFVRRMIDLLGESDIAVPVEGKFHHPLAAVYRVGVLATIRELLSADRLRPVFLFDELLTKRVDVSKLRDVDPHLNTLANLNSPSDYRSALAKRALPMSPELQRHWQQSTREE